MRKLYKVAGLMLSAVSLAAATPVSANAICQFTVTNLGFDSGGDVLGSFVNNGVTYNWTFCSTQGSVTTYAGWGAVTWTSGACNALFAQLLTARTAGIPIWIGFYNGTACTTAGLPASGWLTGTSTNQTFPDGINF
jgi:hypothetical protein